MDQFFLTKHFFWPKNFFLPKKFFWPKNFLIKKKFVKKIILSKEMWNKFFGQIFFVQKFFWSKNFFIRIFYSYFSQKKWSKKFFGNFFFEIQGIFLRYRIYLRYRIFFWDRSIPSHWGQSVVPALPKNIVLMKNSFLSFNVQNISFSMIY